MFSKKHPKRKIVNEIEFALLTYQLPLLVTQQTHQR